MSEEVKRTGKKILIIGGILGIIANIFLYLWLDSVGRDLQKEMQNKVETVKALQ